LSLPERQHRRTSTATAALLALGIVYGDIGTSPLYAIKETFAPGHGLPLEPAIILGGCSTIFWALMVVVSLKYVTLIMRADNRGEGGIMALLALASSSVGEHAKLRNLILIVGLFGAALFYGDAVLTPAISVVSAVEGLEVGTTAFKPYVIPITVTVLIALFAFQRFGTAAVGLCFGPICLLWFLALGAAGVWNIVQHPAILGALDPRHAFGFVTGHGVISFIVLGAVLLAFTGAEALYADMGHFGRQAVRLAWFGLVLPALVLNYFGQGALLLRDPSALQNPFYLAFPGWALYPMVALATAATVIASQATISGAYSITRQAIQLGMLPRMEVVQTSAREYGQIYLPGVNWVLMCAVLAAVIGFGSSSALAAAYGVSVMGTMLTTTLLTYFIVRHRWHYPMIVCLLATGIFFAIDLAFFSASLLKVLQGGWFPLLLGAVIFLLMQTWRQGREALARELRRSTLPLREFLPLLLKDPPRRIPGSAVFLTANPDVTPHALMHNLNHNKVLHVQVVFLTIEYADVPWIGADERVSCRSLDDGFFCITARYGFMQQPDVVQVMELAAAGGCRFDPMQTSFFVSRQKIVPVEHGRSGMATWRDRLFALLARNAGDITDYLNIPPNRVVELGTRVEF
jgi:KUP system potassium uptake protein